LAALQDISLQLKKGSFTAVVGPSGSGKTTLLNIIGTLDKPSTGKVAINNVPINDLSVEEAAELRRNYIGFVFQLFNLLPYLNTIENVMLPLYPYRKKLSFHLGDRAKEVLGMVGLEDRADHLPAQLSGGEQQRVAIARAIIHQPRILLADEPTGNLDTQRGEEIIKLLKRIAVHAHATVVMVTHDFRFAQQADQVISLNDGKIVPYV
jgi:putative ABC transport system ATP-binding protein/lipoprotein-releasing system ATP-binding protein